MRGNIFSGLQLVRIFKGPVKRGPDNWGCTVHGPISRYGWRAWAKMHDSCSLCKTIKAYWGQFFANGLDGSLHIFHRNPIAWKLDVGMHLVCRGLFQGGGRRAGGAFTHPWDWCAPASIGFPIFNVVASPWNLPQCVCPLLSKILK